MTNPTANPAIELYNFYKRYLWNQNDFATWQNGMINYAQGMMDGTFHGSVLQGLGILSSTGLNFTVDGGIAFGPTGNLLVNQSAVTGSLSMSSLPSRNLVVIRPNIIPENYITNPLNPNNQVPLNQVQSAQVLVLSGTPASAPAYPASGANDVVLFGIHLGASASSFGNESLDFEVRDIPGKNSNFAQNFAKYDSRLRPYGILPNIVGIKPSQLAPQFGFPQGFSYGSTVPSIFPKSSSGGYNGAAGDTFLNFLTGSISGADQVSSTFTPTIPASRASIVATVSLTTSDTLMVQFGTQGTRSQCYAAIQNQTTTGAGSISLPSASKLICFVVLSSYDGVNITSLDVYDCRGMSAVSTSPSVLNVSASGTFLTTVGTVRANSASGSFPYYLPLLSSCALGTKFTLKNVGPSGVGNTVTLTPNGSDTIDGAPSLVLNSTPVQDSVTVQNGGTQWDII
jgi:hypothetical protein